MTVLPMFPLGSVVLPGDVVPLHVFEPRYRALVRDCVEAPDHEFGIVLIERGSEVGGGEVRRMVGTAVRMVQVGQTPDGRYAVMSVGVRRIRVNAWLPDDPYPLADVDEWPDDEPDDPAVRDLLGGLVPRVRRAMAFALELGDPVGDPQETVTDEPLPASYQIVTMAPVGQADRYDLLCAAGPRQRLEMLRDRMDDVEALLQFRLGDA